MDTQNNLSPTDQQNSEPATHTEGPSSAKNAIENEDNESSRLQDFISNIPWGKIILGVFILFLMIWGIIYLFSSKKTTTTPETIVQVEESKKLIASNQANFTTSLLGTENYNTIIQPHFSLDPTVITATEPKVALLQALGVLEQSLKFDVWAYLANQTDRANALDSYKNKLVSSVNSSTQWLAQANAKRQEVQIAKEQAIARQAQALQQVNATLASDPANTSFIEEYRQFIEANNQVALLDGEIALLNQIINQAPELLAKANIRSQNIDLNHEAIVKDIKVIDLDDPGLRLVIKPSATR